MGIYVIPIMVFVHLQDVNVDRIQRVDLIVHEVIYWKEEKFYFRIVFFSLQQVFVENRVWSVIMEEHVRMINIVNVYMDGLVLLVTVVRKKKMYTILCIYFYFI